MEIGQFWPIPLSDGKFACGIVLDLVRGSNREFLAGLVNWCGPKEPQPRDIAWLDVVEQGIGHIKIIQEGCGRIIGVLPSDSLPPSPLMWTEHIGGNEWGLYRGLELTEVIDAEQAKEYQRKRTWGYDVINLLAEKRFCTQQ